MSRILSRHQVPYLHGCDPLTGEVIRTPKVTAVRYERERPGELVHMDVKKVGRIHDGGGWKAHGREHGQTGAQKRARIGFDYVHSVVDDHTRVAYSEILPDEKGPTCAAFLLRAADNLASVGIIRIERVMTDNHYSYTRSHDMQAAIKALGAKHILIKPHCPWQNGKVERYNRTLQIAWAYAQILLSNATRSAALAPWLPRVSAGPSSETGDYATRPSGETVIPPGTRTYTRQRDAICCCGEQGQGADWEQRYALNEPKRTSTDLNEPALTCESSISAGQPRIPGIVDTQVLCEVVPNGPQQRQTAGQRL